MNRGGRADVIAAIISGDDFGLAPAINEGVVRAHTQGCLTSASLCPCGPAADQAARAARALPELGVGLHLTLVEERPLSPPGSVPSLVGPEGGFPPSGVVFARRWLAGLIRPQDVRRELRAQFDWMTQRGLAPTHLDSHDHIHVLPGILELVIDEMKRAGLTRLRIPWERIPLSGAKRPRGAFGLGLNLLSRRAARVARQAGLAFPDRFLGFLDAGHFTAQKLLSRIASLEPGVTELSFHVAVGAAPPRPEFAAWGYEWSAELAALLDPEVRDALNRRGVRLRHFGGL